MVYELSCSSIYMQQPGKFILDHCRGFPDSLGGGRQEMGFESTLYEAIQTYYELFVSLKILKPKITTG